MGQMSEEHIEDMNKKIASGEIDARDLREHYFEQEVEIPEPTLQDFARSIPAFNIPHRNCCIKCSTDMSKSRYLWVCENCRIQI